MEPLDIPLTQVTITLIRDDEEISRWEGSNAPHQPWETALWLVNTALEHGWKVDSGHILITGTLGALVPGKPGSYQATYGPLGRINFTIK